MQVVGIREKPAKYHCCDCGKKLSARAKTPEWRKIPANQKRCRSCSARFRGLVRNINVPKSESDKVFVVFPSPVSSAANSLKHSRR